MYIKCRCLSFINPEFGPAPDILTTDFFVYRQKQIINFFVILFCSMICLSLFNVYANFHLNSSIRKGNICVVSTLVSVFFFKINIDYQLQAPLCKNMSVLKLQDNHSSSEWFSIVNWCQYFLITSIYRRSNSY